MHDDGWTLATLKELLESRLDAIDRRHSELAGERNRAVDAALAAANEKAKSHNDVLGAMKDQQTNYLTKDQAAAQFKAVVTAIISIAALVGIIAAIFGAIIWSRGPV
jgi:hypothetical protein